MAEAAEDVQLMSREERLASYRELLEGLEEIIASHDIDATDGDDQAAALVEEVEQQLQTLAQLLNDEETIEVTPGLVKRVERLSGPGETTRTTVLPYASPSRTTASAEPEADGAKAGAAGKLVNAPYEVLFDEREWYACVITGVLPPQQPIERLRYKAWILGYNVEEIVYSEALRPWQPSQTAALTGGVACHVIHPIDGVFVEGTVDRLTLDGTVLVNIPKAAGAASPSPPSLVGAEVPLSNVRVGKHHAELRRRPKTKEERDAQRQRFQQQKRDRMEQERQMAAEKIAKDADDWQSLMGDMLGTDTRAKKKSRR